MRIGFTGTRDGLTPQQKERLRKALIHFQPTEFHHGDCVGADAESQKFIDDLFPFCKVVIHPPIDTTLRALCKGDEYRECKPFLERNWNIVSECEILLACPKEMDEDLRSGTWTTVRYGRELKKKGFLIFRDGSAKPI